MPENKYKVLALDLDDTLLEEDLTVPAAVRDKMHELMERGVCVTLATGRMFATAQRYARELGLTAPIVCFNGAQLRAADDPEPRYQKPVPRELVERIVAFCRPRGWYLQMYEDTAVAVERVTVDTRIDPDARENRCIEMLDFSQRLPEETPKIMHVCFPSQVPVRTAQLREVAGEDLYIAASKPWLIEMMDRTVSKATALERLCRDLGVGMDALVVVGDSSNDLEMVRAAGLGCAVANATPQLKAAADYVCEKERAWGVLEVMERFF